MTEVFLGGRDVFSQWRPWKPCFSCSYRYSWSSYSGLHAKGLPEIASFSSSKGATFINFILNVKNTIQAHQKIIQITRKLPNTKMPSPKILPFRTPNFRHDSSFLCHKRFGSTNKKNWTPQKIHHEDHQWGNSSKVQYMRNQVWSPSKMGITLTHP